MITGCNIRLSQNNKTKHLEISYHFNVFITKIHAAQNWHVLNDEINSKSSVFHPADELIV